MGFIRLMNIVRHMQMYPSDSLTKIVKNVFDFDVYNKDFYEILINAMRNNGLPVYPETFWDSTVTLEEDGELILAAEMDLEAAEPIYSWRIDRSNGILPILLKKYASVADVINSAPSSFKVERKDITCENARISNFTEVTDSYRYNLFRSYY